MIPSGVGITKHPLFFLGGKFRKRSLAAQSTPTDVVQVGMARWHFVAHGAARGAGG